ncbi:MAG: ABC transporter permease [Caldilineaceae bacterium]|nr:ABC transporter permease [Caldilineaceae bacterium]MBP8106819.1 ABC transporter permease [Caldilineaceae bacterium]MBP8121713.1 ABC transporter permease [Caldilineaceae bacterium]MBP9071497.1 ABC transporter permease [Caldilineaceae bacterium]
MLAVIIRRIFWSIPVFLLVTGITFVTMHVLPGGPFDTDKTPPALVAQMEAIYGLNRPVVEQYATWLGNVARLRFGPSLAYRGQSVESFLLPGFSISAQLGGMAMLFALLIGLPAGIIAALKHGHWQDRSATFVAILGVSVPPLVLGPLLYWIFALQLDWLPVAKWASLSEDGLWSYVSHAILPAVTLGAGVSAIIARLTRASLLQVLYEDYMRTARSKGLSERVVTVRHGLRNALIPVVTYIGPLAAAILTGSLVVEQIFAIPGMGRYFVTSISSRDYPMVMAVVVIYSVIIVLVNLFVDILYVFIDPRISQTR